LVYPKGRRVLLARLALKAGFRCLSFLYLFASQKRSRMRLTAELITRAGTYLNPLKDREINLRGQKISVIENLGATQDQFDSIDLSDNEIAKLENIPLLNRVRTLLLNNNKISRLEKGLGASLPNLETLVLTHNGFSQLHELLPLSEFKSLRYLSLIDNMAAKKQYYRLYVIYQMPRLKTLDYVKVKQRERVAAEKLFSGEKGKQLLQTIEDARQEAPRSQQ